VLLQKSGIRNRSLPHPGFHAPAQQTPNKQELVGHLTHASQHTHSAKHKSHKLE